MDSLFYASPVPMQFWVWDGGDFILTECNDAMDELGEGRMHGFLGRRASEIFADQPDTITSLKKAYAGRTNVRYDHWYVMRSTGKRIFARHLYTFVEPDSVMVQMIDATSFKLREEELRHATESLETSLDQTVASLAQKVRELELSERMLKETTRHYESLAASLPFGVFRFRRGSDGRYSLELLSDKACALSGMGKDALMADPGSFARSSLAAERRVFEEKVAEALKTVSTLEWEGRAVIRGTVRYLRIEMYPEDPSGSVYHGFIEDKTEERESASARDELFSALDRLESAMELVRSGAKPFQSTSFEHLWKTLSDRELQVVELALQGLSNQEIAQKLFIAESTVKKHLNAAFVKLDISGRAELFALARGRRP